MALNLYLSSKASPRGSFVISQTNPTAQAMRDLVLGDVIAANLFIVDGAGGFDAISGAAGSSVIAAIGTPGFDPVWVNSTWTAISSPYLGWSGQIAANTDALAALYVGKQNPLELEFAIRVKDISGNPIVFANPIIKIWNRLIDDDLVSTNPFNNSGDGAFAIPNGVDVGVVSGLGLSLIPRRVLVSIRKPAGGLAISASVVDGTITTDGFIFNLSGQTDSGLYRLDYILLF